MQLLINGSSLKANRSHCDDAPWQSEDEEIDEANPGVDYPHDNQLDESDEEFTDELYEDDVLYEESDDFSSEEEEELDPSVPENKKRRRSSDDEVQPTRQHIPSAHGQIAAISSVQRHNQILNFLMIPNGTLPRIERHDFSRDPMEEAEDSLRLLSESPRSSPIKQRLQQSAFSIYNAPYGQSHMPSPLAMPNHHYNMGHLPGNVPHPSTVNISKLGMSMNATMSMPSPPLSMPGNDLMRHVPMPSPPFSYHDSIRNGSSGITPANSIMHNITPSSVNYGNGFPMMSMNMNMNMSMNMPMMSRVPLPPLSVSPHPLYSLNLPSHAHAMMEKMREDLMMANRHKPPCSTASGLPNRTMSNSHPNVSAGPRNGIPAHLNHLNYGLMPYR